MVVGGWMMDFIAAHAISQTIKHWNIFIVLSASEAQGFDKNQL
jgi:hypothetical protein